MRFVYKLRSAIDLILRIWPSELGGYYLRYNFWKHRFAYCGVGIRFGDQLMVTGFPLIHIGEETTIMSRSYLYAHDSKRVTIGSRCSFNHNVLLGAAGGEIVIGNDVLIGPNVVLRASNHIFDSPDVSIRDQGHAFGRIVIGDDVWLAANVVVISGVTIGNGCVVGAGSIVTRDLPPMTLCVGNPARPIRSRIDQKI
jgi:acetyltransferase-like isoleucine patch superfamily enzyme